MWDSLCAGQSELGDAEANWQQGFTMIQTDDTEKLRRYLDEVEQLERAARRSVKVE